MSDFVRVALPNGHEATLSRAYVDGLDDAPKVLDAPATNSRGVPLPATRKGGRPLKLSTTVATEAVRKTARKSTNGGVAVEPEEASK